MSTVEVLESAGTSVEVFDPVAAVTVEVLEASGATVVEVATGAVAPPGTSAYQIAVAQGFVGTVADWLASLVGPGVPPGGATAQILAKATAGDYDTEWVDRTQVLLLDYGVTTPPAGTPYGSLIFQQGP